MSKRIAIVRAGTAGLHLGLATALKSGDGLAGQPEQANGHAGVASESGRRRAIGRSSPAAMGRSGQSRSPRPGSAVSRGRCSPG